MSLKWTKMRSYCILVSFALWICLLGSCRGLRYVVERGNLEVIGPESLQGFYDSSVRRFGIPEHGGAVAGIVVYTKTNRESCSGFGGVGISFRPRAGSLPVILLVDRGSCFFDMKVLNAQMAGAAAVLVVENVVRPLITMEVPQYDVESANFLQAIDIPCALITKSFGDKIKEALSREELVSMNLAFNSPNEVALPPHEQVKYDFWISSNLGCGPKCQEQLEFVRDFREVAKVLEGRGYAQFTPHFVTWYCQEAFILSPRCKSQCINHGRYCSPDPQEELFRSGCQKQTDGMIRTGCFRGRDIVIQSLVQACLHKVVKASGKPCLWWDYVNDFTSQCSMKNAMYGMSSCRDGIIRRLGLDIDKVYECVGDIEANQDHPLLRAEQYAQIGGLGRGKDVTVVPTLVINGNHYRGKLVKADVLEAICAAMKGEVKPDICPKAIPEEAKQDIVPVDLHEATLAIIPHMDGPELDNREDALESIMEDEAMEARLARDIGTWNWTISDPSGHLEMKEEKADTNNDRISHQDESSDMALVEGKNVNQIKDGDHEKGSDLVSSDTEQRLRRSESTTKYIPGRWNPGKITNPGGWQVQISSGDAAEYGK